MNIAAWGASGVALIEQIIAIVEIVGAVLLLVLLVLLGASIKRKGDSAEPTSLDDGSINAMKDALEELLQRPYGVMPQGGMPPRNVGVYTPNIPKPEEIPAEEEEPVNLGSTWDYTPEIKEPEPKPEPEPEPEPPAPPPAFGPSFTERVGQLGENMKAFYLSVRSALMGVNGMRSSISKRQEKFLLNGAIAAKIVITGNEEDTDRELVMYLKADPSKYKGHGAEDVSNNPAHSATPAFLHLENEKNVENALHIIKTEFK